MSYVPPQPPHIRRNEMVGGLGMTIGEMQSVARRQLAGSIVAGVVVIVAAALSVTARSSHHASAYETVQNSHIVQQPNYVTPSDHLIATTKRKIETP